MAHIRWWLLILLVASSGRAGESTKDMGRQVVPLDDGWIFTFDGSGRQAAADIPAASWNAVTLPHTWNADDGAQVAKPYRRGVGHYRRILRAAPEWQGRSVFLTVGAANAKAVVVVNGAQVLEHVTGFTAFTADLTRVLRPDADNDVLITVDNRHNDDYPPLVSDYTFFGGIHRRAWLTITDPLHVSLTDHGSSGIFLLQKEVGRERAVVEVRTCMANDTAAAVADATMRVTVIDGEGREVSTLAGQSLPVPAQGAITQILPLVIDRPRLWDGRNDPHRYRVRVAVQRDGKTLDAVEQPLGLRWFSVDPDKGFLLNGRPYVLHGPSLHQDRPGKGWAISDADRAEDVGLLTEIGATCVRLVHYPHAPATLDLLDAAGIVAWCEIPVAYHIGTQPAFGNHCRTMLTEMIRQLGNHPSICFWGMFNEITSLKKDCLGLIADLHRVAKDEDPSRLTTGAAGTVDSDKICDITDVIGFNRYLGWFVPGAGMLGVWVESGHRLHPKRCMGVSEYGAEGRIDRHADHRSRNTAGVLEKDSRMGTEEYQAHLHEELWSQINGLTYLWCKIPWNLTDWSTAGKKGMTMFPSDGVGRMGFVTHDRKTKKDVFWWYKANWSTEPVLHLCEQRFTPREYREADIRVYSNLAEQLTLTVNGEQVMTLPEQFGKRTIWPHVRLPVGQATVVVTAVKNGREFQDRAVWEVPDRMPPGRKPAHEQPKLGF